MKPTICPPVTRSRDAVASHAASSPASAAAPSRRRVILATSLGNALEFFDFTVYSFFAALIGKLFFPVGGSYGPLLLSLATFGAGFVVRPLGGIVIGTYADRRGRKAAMTLTILMMALGTAIIGLAPTYAQIGIAAPLLIIAARLIQGFSAGGEVGAATTFLMESAAPGTRGYLVSWQLASQGASALAGALCGMLLTHVLTPAALESWGWRVPFLAGLLIGPVGLYIRSHLHETLHAAPQSRERAAVPARYDVRRIVLGTLLMVGSTSSMYILVFYLPSWLTRFTHAAGAAAFLPSGLAGLILTVASPFCGKLTDRLGSRKPILYATAVATLVALYPAFALMLHAASLVPILAAVALLIGLWVVANPAGFLLLLEGFPREMRGRSLGIIYSVGVTLFGGFAPFAVTWLIGATGSAYAPVWYMAACSAVSFAALIAFDERITD
ncbi:MFS transporter [Paraburkholderia sp. MMS20-SJTR3]|uniref:MFS transporter n=1 Tax=Paraburkholderia sejongensis TaxID=2886946 RepID=A0ABS8K0J7_9BURK|nr:MFS transporter [Paraburkholderia sp. MMS20-SJTR3]MCC8395672.1 MFS transporter [Paraburkholderia sp. MMS20-SJTR3]